MSIGYWFVSIHTGTFLPDSGSLIRPRQKSAIQKLVVSGWTLIIITEASVFDVDSNKKA
jgi:hypothetical protein